jgi:hypothetical protein
VVILAFAPDEAPRSSANTGPPASDATRTGTAMALTACDAKFWKKEALRVGLDPKPSVKTTHRERMAEVSIFMVTRSKRLNRPSFAQREQNRLSQWSVVN